MNLRVVLRHMPEHKFRHNFRDLLNTICNCSSAIDSTKHYLLHCLNFKNERQTLLLQNVRNINPNLLSMNQGVLTHLLLYGDNTLTDNNFISFRLSSIFCSNFKFLPHQVHFLGFVLNLLYFFCFTYIYIYLYI